jgi:ATP-dependent Clp protease ATP-binding subunit ClpA
VAQTKADRQAAFLEATKLMPWKVEILQIPFKKVWLPAYLMQPSSADARPRKTVIVLTGFDGTAEDLHFKTAQAALERGWTVHGIARAAGELADRYISDRYLPDKAIDLIDEAGSRLRIRSMTTPPDLAELDASIEEARKAKEDAIDGQDFERAARLRDEEKKLIENRQRREDEWRSEGMDQVLTVDEEVIAEVLAVWTGIPVFKLTQEETDKLLHMEDELHKRVIGQEQSITAVSKAIRRTRAGLKDPKRPSGSFIFLGPSGVGKTELAKTLAEYLFGDENSLIHLDMSEYMEKHTVSRLIGSPPGYVGYDEGGQLTEQVRRKPFSVVLFDEVEKAHPDVFNTLLQILEDGRLTDAQGRTVDFKNTILIMTSNLGTKNLTAPAVGFVQADDATIYEKMKRQVDDELKKHFRPEFLNRIDDTIVFHPLSRDEVKQIVDLMLGRVKTQLRVKDLDLELTDRLKEWLADMFDHTLVLNQDDPQKYNIVNFACDYKNQLADVRVVPSCSSEGLAKFVYEHINVVFKTNHPDTRVIYVKVYEDEKNTAIYYGRK